MMECFKYVTAEIDESLTKTEKQEGNFKANILYLKCIIGGREEVDRGKGG